MTSNKDMYFAQCELVWTMAYHGLQPQPHIPRTPETQRMYSILKTGLDRLHAELVACVDGPAMHIPRTMPLRALRDQPDDYSQVGRMLNEGDHQWPELYAVFHTPELSSEQIRLLSYSPTGVFTYLNTICQVNSSDRFMTQFIEALRRIHRVDVAEYIEFKYAMVNRESLV